MKICIVSNLYNPDIIGGAENVVANLANRLAERDHEVLVIATKPSAFAPVYQGLYRGNAKRPRFYLQMEDVFSNALGGVRNAVMTPIWHTLDIWNPRSYYFVRRTLKDFAPDIINTHNIFGMSTAVWSAAQSLGLPMVHTLYDYSLLCPRSTMFKAGKGVCATACRGCSMYSMPKRAFAGAVDAVIAPSQFILDIFEGSGMFPTQKKLVVPHGVEGDPARPLLAPEQVRFLCIGQTSEHKGILTLIKAFIQVPGKTASLSVMGLGDSLRRSEKMASADKRISFQHFVDEAAKKSLFMNNSVLVLPSLWEEPFGQTVLEAYARGLPVIAARTGGVPELVEEGSTGFMFEPGNEEDLARKMEFFVKEPGLSGSMSANCVRKAAQFTLEKQVGKYCEIYESVLASRAASRR